MNSISRGGTALIAGGTGLLGREHAKALLQVGVATAFHKGIFGLET